MLLLCIEIKIQKLYSTLRQQVLLQKTQLQINISQSFHFATENHTPKMEILLTFFAFSFIQVKDQTI
jgi:hypothetical protein